MSAEMNFQLVGQRLDSLKLQFGIVVGSVEMSIKYQAVNSSGTGKLRLNWH